MMGGPGMGNNMMHNNYGPDGPGMNNYGPGGPGMMNRGPGGYPGNQGGYNNMQGGYNQQGGNYPGGYNRGGPGMGPQGGYNQGGPGPGDQFGGNRGYQDGFNRGFPNQGPNQGPGGPGPYNRDRSVNAEKQLLLRKLVVENLMHHMHETCNKPFTLWNDK